eukprot:12930358-Prorocentrum_lima.AAC.1
MVTSTSAFPGTQLMSGGLWSLSALKWKPGSSFALVKLVITLGMSQVITSRSRVKQSHGGNVDVR